MDAPDLPVVEAGARRSLGEGVAAVEGDLDGLLGRAGAVLFRGFDVPSPEAFRAVVEAQHGPPLAYEYGSTPRHSVAVGVFTASEYPASERIPLHNEMSYTTRWPRFVWFWCVKPAGEGGRTPLADSRRVLRSLPADVVDVVRDRGVLYVRNFRNGIDLPWTKVFGTANPREVEAYCSAAGIDIEWVSEKHLRTRQRCQGTAIHPDTGEEVWFNQLHLFHHSRLNGTPFERAFRPETRPRDALFGDGSPIPDELVEEVGRALDAGSFSFPWQAGDVLCIDNMLAAHGREPFTGEREVLVAMARAGGAVGST